MMLFIFTLDSDLHILKQNGTTTTHELSGEDLAQRLNVNHNTLRMHLNNVRAFSHC